MYKKLSQILVFILFLLVSSQAQAFWIWTPESGKWLNPKYSVKETPQLQFEYTKTFFDQGEYGEALKEFRKLVKQYRRSREAAEAQYYIGMVYEKLNNPYQAFQEYQKVIDNYPFSERSTEIIDIQYRIATDALEGQKEGLWANLTGVNIKVTELFRKVVENAPYGKNAPQAQYKLALVYQEQGLYEEAHEEFEKTMNEYPDSDEAKFAQYQMALADASRSADAQYEQKTTKKAVEGFEEFIESYPEAELAEDAKERIHSLREKEAENVFVVAEFYEKQKQFKAAKIYYGDVVAQFRDTSWAQKALDKLQELGDI